MPVDDQHPQYEEFFDDWTRCRDAFGGRRLIKAAGSKYLPRMEAQQVDEYADYLQRAQWFDGTERTSKGLAGSIGRNDTRLEVPAVMEPDLEDVTLTGQDVHAFSQRILLEQVLMGRVGVEVAMPREESPDQRPYWNLWAAESITNWAEARIHGRSQPVLVVLREPVMRRLDDFSWDEAAVQFRVMKLVQFTEDTLVYVQEIWVKNPNDTAGMDEKWLLDETIIPLRRGVPLDEIPFTLFGASSIEFAVEKPPMLGVADQNIGMYINSADYENALAAIKPLYTLFGFETGSEIIIGSRRALVSELPDGNAKILQGADPVGLRKAMAEKQANMGVLGGQIIEDGGPAETATAVRIKQGGRQASLRTIATTFGTGLEKTLAFHAKWVGGADPEQVTATPNMDFIDSTLTPEQINAYLALLQAGKITYATFYNLLQGGELTRPGVDAEQELEEIEAEEESELAEAQARMAEMEAERVAQGGGEEE